MISQYMENRTMKKTTSLDVYRQPRIDNPKHSVDIGAAECQKTEGTVLIMR